MYGLKVVGIHHHHQFHKKNKNGYCIKSKVVDRYEFSSVWEYSVKKSKEKVIENCKMIYAFFEFCQFCFLTSTQKKNFDLITFQVAIVMQYEDEIVPYCQSNQIYWEIRYRYRQILMSLHLHVSMMDFQSVPVIYLPPIRHHKPMMLIMTVPCNELNRNGFRNICIIIE